MFTNTYLKLIAATILDIYSSPNSCCKLSGFGSNIYSQKATSHSEIYGWASTSSSTGAEYTKATIRQLFFNAAGVEVYRGTSYAYTIGNLVFSIAQKSAISAGDYSIESSLYDYTTVSQSSGVYVINVSNTSGSDITFNTIQIAAPYNTSVSTSKTSTNLFLLAEFDIGQQTLGAGYSKSFRITRQNLSA